jgi:hypothetical protein
MEGILSGYRIKTKQVQKQWYNGIPLMITLKGSIMYHSKLWFMIYFVGCPSFSLAGFIAFLSVWNFIYNSILFWFWFADKNIQLIKEIENMLFLASKCFLIVHGALIGGRFNAINALIISRILSEFFFLPFDVWDYVLCSFILFVAQLLIVW